MAGASRPLSPHLQVYRFRITMATSILHRVTGTGLAVGTLLLTWWLLAVASGPEAFGVVKGFLTHWTGRLVLFGFTWSAMFHLLSGLRHLFLDAGLGLEVADANRSGWAVAAGSVVLTLIAWAYGYGLLGS